MKYTPNTITLIDEINMKVTVRTTKGIDPLRFSALFDRRVVYNDDTDNSRKLKYDQKCQELLDSGCTPKDLYFRHLRYPGISRHFEAYCNKKNYCESITSLPDRMHPIDKDRENYTFNRFFSFIKYRDPKTQKLHLFYALREGDDLKPKWRPFYVEDLDCEKLEHMIEMFADGCNFNCRIRGKVDDEIFYKKTHKERYSPAQGLRGKINSITSFIKGLLFRPSPSQILQRNVYIFNLCDTVTAKREYFGLPVVKHLKPEQVGQRLKIPFDAHLAMSHAGKLKAFVVSHKRFHENWNVTTLSTYQNDVQTYYDSFVELDSVYKRTLHFHIKSEYKTNRRYQFLQKEGCESTYFYLIKWNDGEYEIFYRYEDYDALGLNPLINYTLNHRQSEGRLLPILPWRSLTLPNVEEVFGLMTPVQCGPGNLNASIQLNVKLNGEVGVIWRRIKDSEWVFYKTKDISHKPISPEKAFKSDSRVQLHSKNTHWLGEEYDAIRCSDFNVNHSELRFEVQRSDSTFYFNALRRKNMIKSFTGQPSEYWEIASCPQSKVHLPLFERQHAYRVHIQETDTGIELQVPNVESNGTLKLAYR